jgi:hypothetical protein
MAGSRASTEAHLGSRTIFAEDLADIIFLAYEKLLSVIYRVFTLAALRILLSNFAK